MGREFTITHDTLDPRPETETLISAALERGPVETFVDLGTGSGVIAVTLLAEWAQARAVATDLSPAALQVAETNARTHGVSERLSFLQAHKEGAWFPDGLTRYDMILSNPPYISSEEMRDLSREVLEHDPHMALTPGGDGLDAYRAICAQGTRYLNQGGTILVEIGFAQGAAVLDIFCKAGFRNVQCLADLDGRDRVMSPRSVNCGKSPRFTCKSVI